MAEERSDLQAHDITASNSLHDPGQSVTSTDAGGGQGKTGQLDADEHAATGESSVSAGARRSSELAEGVGHRDKEGAARMTAPGEGPAFPVLAKLRSIGAGLGSLLSVLLMPVSALFRKLFR